VLISSKDKVEAFNLFISEKGAETRGDKYDEKHTEEIENLVNTTDMQQEHDGDEKSQSEKYRMRFGGSSPTKQLESTKYMQTS